MPTLSPSFDSYVERVVAAAPPLSDEQADRLALLLAPAAGGEAS